MMFQKEKDITETTDMDYMVKSTSQLEQEENKNEYNVLEKRLLLLKLK